jgi:hypothetical protein
MKRSEALLELSDVAQNHDIFLNKRVDLIPNGAEPNRNVGRTKVEERRTERRIEASASVVLTPLAAVATRLGGSVVNVSTGGVRVHVNTQLKQLPRVGEVYRVQSQDDQMLCEVRNAEIYEAGAAFGLQIVYWGNSGSLRRLVSDSQ